MPLAKGVVNLLGVGTEAFAHHKQKKQLARETSPNPDTALPSAQPETAHSAVQASGPGLEPPFTQRRASDAFAAPLDEEDEWLCDEAQEQLEDNSLGVAVGQPRIENLKSPEGLPCPVIIPQKRPESKTHGFVRAYAPALSECGIDQTTFLHFLKGFEDSIKGTGYFNAVNLAIAAGVFTYTVSAVTVNPAVHLAALAVHTSIEAGKRVHNTLQINKFLDEMNAELFRPQGLYAVLMTYRPQSSDSVVEFDWNDNILKSIMSRTSGDRSRFRTASGTTYGEVELPECAPLMFPGLEAADPQQKKNALKRAGAFMNDYRDRRARAQFQHNNPDSALNILPKEEFSSIFADPNHPINKGGSLNALTGGYLYKGATAIRDRGGSKYIPFKLGRQAGKEGTGVGGTRGQTVKRLISENVLYLMIVNMPTDEEMKEAVMLAERVRMSKDEAGT